MDYQIAGETIVLVKGGGTNLEYGDPPLGLTDRPITIMPRFRHQNLRVDTYGTFVPPDVMMAGGDCIIEMTLVFYSNEAVQKSMASSSAGTIFGTSIPAGSLMSSAPGFGGSDNDSKYLSLFLQTKYGENWEFPAAYLFERPMVFPMGTKRSLTKLRWRAIPYVGRVTKGMDVSLKNQVLWSHPGNVV